MAVRFPPFHKRNDINKQDTKSIDHADTATADRDCGSRYCRVDKPVEKESGGEMREIKFRAMRVFEPNEWVFGNLLTDYESPNHTERITAITYFNGFQKTAQVCPETVGQFTGLTDANGTDIYEGDIVTVIEQSMFSEFVHRGIVEIEPVAICVDFPQHGASVQIQEFVDDPIHVIGNVHEHPHLVELPATRVTGS